MRTSAGLGLIAATVLLASCGDGGEDETAAPPPTSAATSSPTQSPAATPSATPSTTPSPTPEVEVPEGLAFTAATLDGGTFDGASLVGRPAVLWFWAPWCPVCQREAPLIADLAAQYDGQVAFVGVAGLSGDLAAMEEFVANGGVEGIAHIDDRDGEVYSRFEVTQQYDFGFVSADGTVEVIRGPLEEDEIVAEVERLVAD